jgi:predicted TPR repeat methyltransferase
MTAPLFVSSGDLIADRRFAIAQELLARGDLAGAADLLVQAIEAAPRFVSAWFALGEVHEKLGSRDDAVAAFQEVCALDAEDRLGAGLHLVRLGALAPGDMPSSYVRTLFDQYAPRFDAALTEGLAYRGPEILREAIARACAGEGRPLRFDDALDLGCGTGLAGAALRPMVRRLTGVDLSERMIAAARAKTLYDRLATGDLVTFLQA